MVSGQPAISLPLYQGQDGMPLGVQLVGRPAGEGPLLALAAPLMAADPTPEELREAGLAALKAAQADPDQIVLAARLLSQAADAFAKAGKPAVAPCTIRVAEGMRSIQLAKNGFVDPQAVRAAIKAGENAPVTVKGQAVKGNSVLTGEWVVLFRSDDPQCWDTNSVAPKYAILLASAPDTIRFLRIKRLDTDEEVVVPITKKSLSDPANRKSRYGWIGSNQNVWGGYHLGIFDTRLVNKVGDIGVTPDAPTLSGWGFGHKAGAAGQTYCVWAGKEIKKTVFEISVTSLAVDPSKLLK